MVKAKAKFRLLSRFHGLRQASASHYTLDGDPSERLMFKYYEYLVRTLDLVQKEFGSAILGNLEKFPADLDPSLRERLVDMWTRSNTWGAASDVGILAYSSDGTANVVAMRTCVCETLSSPPVNPEFVVEADARARSSSRVRHHT